MSEQWWLKSAIFRSNYLIFNMIDDNAQVLVRRLHFPDESHI